jgi:hypothetical protein
MMQNVLACQIRIRKKGKILVKAEQSPILFINKITEAVRVEK